MGESRAASGRLCELEETPSTVFIGTDGVRRHSGPDIWADEAADQARRALFTGKDVTD